MTPIIVFDRLDEKKLFLKKLSMVYIVTLHYGFCVALRLHLN